LEKHKLYNPNQSEFRKNRNTMEQCIRLENDIQKSFVNKYITVGVFIDFQKTFDVMETWVTAKKWYLEIYMVICCHM
jgi:hypothetical protein